MQSSKLKEGWEYTGFDAGIENTSLRNLLITNHIYTEWRNALDLKFRTNLPYLVCWTFDPAFITNRSFYIGFYRDRLSKILSAAILKGSAK